MLLCDRFVRPCKVHGVGLSWLAYIQIYILTFPWPSGSRMRGRRSVREEKPLHSLCSSLYLHGTGVLSESKVGQIGDRNFQRVSAIPFRMNLGTSLQGWRFPKQQVKSLGLSAWQRRDSTPAQDDPVNVSILPSCLQQQWCSSSRCNRSRCSSCTV